MSTVVGVLRSSLQANPNTGGTCSRSDIGEPRIYGYLAWTIRELITHSRVGTLLLSPPGATNNVDIVTLYSFYLHLPWVCLVSLPSLVSLRGPQGRKDDEGSM